MHSPKKVVNIIKMRFCRGRGLGFDLSFLHCTCKCGQPGVILGFSIRLTPKGLVFSVSFLSNVLECHWSSQRLAASFQIVDNMYDAIVFLYQHVQLILAHKMFMQGMKAVNFPDSQYDHHQISQAAKFVEQSRLEARRTIKARQFSRLTDKHCHIMHICSCMTIKYSCTHNKHLLSSSLLPCSM